MCSEYCSCQVISNFMKSNCFLFVQSCFNNAVYHDKRNEAIQAILSKNQHAFRTQVSRGLRPLEVAGRGCHCVKSHCLKKYCECFQVKRYCDGRCRCVSCQNQSGFSQSASLPTRLVGVGYGSLLDYQQHFLQPTMSINKASMNTFEEVITGSAVDKICSRLLEVASKDSLMMGTHHHHDSKIPILKAFTESLDSLFKEEEIKRKYISESDNSSSGRKRRRFGLSPIAGYL